MSFLAHKSIDVDVFKVILDQYLLHENTEHANTSLIDLIKQIHSVEIKLPGIDSEKKNETKNINLKQYGFKNKSDCIINTKQNVFENETIISFSPKNVYELEDKVKKMPIPYSDKGKILKQLISDAFERLKVKAKHILENSDNDEQITHYAKKNIQVALRNSYDARMCLMKTQKTKNHDAIMLALMINVFMVNVVNFLQNMFSSYYCNKKTDKNKQKADLYDIIDVNVLMEPPSEYKTKKEEQINPPKIVWNGNVNSLATIFFDLMQVKTNEGKPLLQADSKDIQDLLHNFFVDKNGLAINKNTIATCLRPSKEEKRSNGNKRIDLDGLIGRE